MSHIPTLLVIASINDENWVQLCSEYSTQFRVIQTTWDKISLSSYSDKKYKRYFFFKFNSKYKKNYKT